MNRENKILVTMIACLTAFTAFFYFAPPLVVNTTMIGFAVASIIYAERSMPAIAGKMTPKILFGICATMYQMGATVPGWGYAVLLGAAALRYIHGRRISCQPTYAKALEEAKYLLSENPSIIELGYLYNNLLQSYDRPVQEIMAIKAAWFKAKASINTEALQQQEKDELNRQEKELNLRFATQYFV